jgi:hypothetical protein
VKAVQRMLAHAKPSMTLDVYADLFDDTYNHHRGHTALGGQPPASRVPNLSGQYS